MLFMHAPRQGLTPVSVLPLSVATGLCVSSNDDVQPLLNTIAQHSSLSVSLAGASCHLSEGEIGLPGRVGTAGSHAEPEKIH